MLDCNICEKPVPDKGKGFRVFVEYDFVNIFEAGKENIPHLGKCKHQVRICESCLKNKNFETIIL